MKVLLRSIAQPGANATESRLEVATLTIGRGTDQHLVLGDLRVALAQAEISIRKGLLGPVARIDAKARNGLWVNGSPSLGADLGAGDVIELGRHRLTVGKPVGDADLVLTLDERFAAHEERSHRRQALRLSLADAGFSRRRWAWALFLLVLVPGLLLPVLLAHRNSDQAETISRERVPKASPGMDILWSSGPLSKAHHALQNDCNACHRKPFEQANDTGCRSCHGDLQEHASSLKVAAQTPFSQQRCTDCHREHNGAQGLVPTDNSTCVHCHAEPERLPGSPLKPVHDFSKTHPEFRLHLARREGDGFVWQPFEQSQAEARHQDTGLKFPHDLHLAAKGIDAPDGVRQLQCGDCHTASADGSSFLPVTMQAHCADCHRLDFDTAAPERTLPHAKPDEAIRVVRDHYAALALRGIAPAAPKAEGGGIRRRADRSMPLATPDFAPTQAWATARAEVALRDVFERRTCFYCHDISRDGPPESPWRIAPVAAQKPAMRAAVFPHSAHRTESCDSCHAAGTSKLSRDVLLPDIQRCRDCHGDTGAMSETPSPCQSCHVYHLHPLQAADAARAHTP